MVSTAQKIVPKLVGDTGVPVARKESDTIKLWEGYKDQALLWRALALLQIPTTLIMALFALVLWNTRKIELKVPAKPLPGIYAAQEIPDTEFIDMSTNFINLVATYQPAIARRQFTYAKEFLREPILEKFNQEWMGTELRTIEQTGRTQIFFADPTKAKVFRRDKVIEVVIQGERLKTIAGRQMDPITTVFSITMTTIPRNDLNPYGIVITNLGLENITPEQG